MSARIIVVGIGADGMAGLAPKSCDELRRATVIFGSSRQLGLLDDTVTDDRQEWPSPMLPALPTLFDGIDGDVHVVASGDPMLHGIGATLIRIFGADRVTVLPHVSSVALACARLGWPVQATEVISLVSADPQTALRHGGRAIVLSSDRTTPQALAALLEAHGHGDSELTLLEELGGPGERRRDAVARDWANAAPTSVNDLNVVAVHYLPDERVAWLPDDAFLHDGQITKQSIRAVTLAALAPRPGERLWDVGSGSGSIAIEWCRSAPGCTAVAFERHEMRGLQIGINAATFGLRLDVRGAAPDSFDGAPDPDVIFIGGGITGPGLLDACFKRLPLGGRLVVNIVTAESEVVVLQWYSELGGELSRYQHYRGEPVGGFTGWRPAMPVTQWSVVKS